MASEILLEGIIAVLCLQRQQLWRLTWINTWKRERRNLFGATMLIGLPAESSRCRLVTTRCGQLDRVLSLDRLLSLNYYHGLSVTGVFRWICFSPRPQIDKMENDISPTAHLPVFLYQSAHLVTNLPPPEKTFPVLTLSGRRSNAASFLHVLETASFSGDGTTPGTRPRVLV